MDTRPRLPVKKTPLEAWIHKKIARTGTTSAPLLRSTIEDYQLERLRETVTLARTKSPFYREKLLGHPAEEILSIEDVRKLPFTTAAELKYNPMRFLCCSQDEIHRIVTLESSGTTGTPKRIFFTADDQELTRDFFHHALGVVARPGDTVLVMLPGHRPGSVGELFAQSAIRMSVHPVRFGLIHDVRAALAVMEQEQVDTLLGTPAQVLALATYERPGRAEFRTQVKNVILNTDSVPQAMIRRIQHKWNCRVFNHYAMTEMGLGGGLECGALAGYHMREADLLFEVIDPVSGEVLPDGSEGEVVFTTLTRKGMPLIRYRTGDISKFVTEPCACGTVLKRMAPVRDRLTGRVELRGGGHLSMSTLDEAIFALPGVLNLEAALTTVHVQASSDADGLSVKVHATEWAGGNIAAAVKRALLSIPVIAEKVRQGYLTVNGVEVDMSGQLWKPVKRVIKDERRKERA